MYETPKIFTRHKGRKIYHVERHQGIYTEFWYMDAETGREFDVRELPAQFLDKDARDVSLGDSEAHRRVIRRAIAADHDFRKPKAAVEPT